MAYENFIPQIWSEAINRDLERRCVFVEDCNRQYEGDVKKAGDTVRILGVGQPTITTTTAKAISLSAAENVEDTSVAMPIRQISYYNYKIDDIDKRQAVGGVMDALKSETSARLASTMDAYVAALSVDALAVKYAANDVQITATNVLAQIDVALEKLYENDVDPGSGITVTLPPWVYTLFRQAYVSADTNNSGILKNGKVAMYGNAQIKMSNNVHKASTTYSIMVRTNQAIAFANPMNHIEAYRPEGGFSDAVKGFVLYDAKIVRPKEMIIMNVKK